ncbi:MAG: diguanylate cyclase [Anaerolineales bacterium]|jgi:diguanylate cyclase (GGDEF)-like protein/PAS domain S-box-containing protein
MTLEQAETDQKYLNYLVGTKLSNRNKFLLGVLIVFIYGCIAWLLTGYLGRIALTIAILPIIGFIFLFGFWGYIVANLSSFLVLALAMYVHYGNQITEMIGFTNIVYISVLVIVAALISEQKGSVRKLYNQVITQKSEENRLINSRDGYRNLVYRIPIGLYRTTPDGKILEASSALVEMLGYPDFATLSFVTIDDEIYVDPIDRKNEENLLLEEGLVRDYELRLYRRDGEIIWVRDNVRAIVNDAGEIVCYEGSLEDITERKLMEEAEKEQRMLAEALRDSAAALSGTLEFEEVLDRILVNLDHVVPHDAANIMLVDKGAARIARSKGYISDWEEEVRKSSRFLVEDIPTLSQMNKTGKPLAIPNTSDSDLWVKLPHSEWMRSYAGAPIRVKDKIIGFLNLNSASVGFFTDAKSEWLQAFADQAGLAIENARMYGEILEHARQTTLINAITQTTIMAPDVEGMIQVLADRLGELLSSDSAFITLWDDKLNKVTPGAAFGPLRDRYTEIEVLPNKKTITSMVLEKGQSMVLDYDDFPIDEHAGKSEDCTAKSTLALPLIADGKKLGAVIISYDDAHQFLEEEISLSEQVARIIALAIYKAKLFESEKERTEELARAISIITALSKAATRVEAVNNLDRMIDILGEALAELGLQSMVMLQSNERDQLKIHHTSNDVHEYFSESTATLLASIGPRLSSDDFYYYNEVIHRKNNIFFEDIDQMFGSIFPVLDQLGKQDFDHETSDFADKRGFLLPLMPGKKVIGCLMIWGDEIDEQDLPAFSLFASQIAVAFENAHLLERIQQIAITDELTGLYNRRGLFEIGRLEIERTRRYNLPLSAIVIDIDHFKKVNDRYSHAIGDQVLQSFANCLQENTRELDVVGRVGGEEFVLLLPGSNQDSARKTANRLQDLIAENVVLTSMGEIRITISQGVAQMDTTMNDLNDLVQAADRALYQAKETGRNKVVSSSILS